MNRSKVIDICRRVLGVRPEDGPRSQKSWTEFNRLVKSYGAPQVVEAFENWCVDNRGRIKGWPISRFCDQADGILNGVIVLGANPEIDELSSRLYQIAKQAFTGKEREGLVFLRRSYSDAEIERAYKEYTGELDEFKLVRAPRDFIDGGAVPIILTHRKQDEEHKKQQADALAQQASIERQTKEIVERLHAKPEVSEGDPDAFFSEGK